MYKLSKFNVVTELENDYILFNTFSCATVKLNNEYYNLLFNGRIEKEKPEDFEKLKQMSFVCDIDFDEETYIEKLENLLKDKSVLMIIFITTEQCNFRCEYCYEEHRNAKIKSETYEAVLKYVENLTETKKVIINWFGGEPTLEKKAIIEFLTKLKGVCGKKDIILESAMTTNAYLLDEELFNKFLDLGITDYQITIDGLKEEHDSKRFLANRNGSFDTIISNIKNMVSSNKDFKVTLRYNYDSDSKIIEFIDFVYEIVKEDKRFIFNFNPIGIWTSDNTVKEQKKYSHKNDFESYAIKKGLMLNRLEQYDKIFTNICYASVPFSFVVNPYSEILRCTVKLDSEINKVGQLINEGEIIFNSNLDKWLNSHYQKKCNNCNVKPLCLGKFCPNRTNEDACQKNIINNIHRCHKLKYNCK